MHYLDFNHQNTFWGCPWDLAYAKLFNYLKPCMPTFSFLAGIFSSFLGAWLHPMAHYSHQLSGERSIKLPVGLCIALQVSMRILIHIHEVQTKVGAAHAVSCAVVSHQKGGRLFQEERRSHTVLPASSCESLLLPHWGFTHPVWPVSASHVHVSETDKADALQKQPVIDNSLGPKLDDKNSVC